MPVPPSGISRLLRIIRRMEDATLIFLLGAMIALAIGQILLRNVLGAGIDWGDPLLRILVLWVGLAGAIVATREHRHIAINVLMRLLPTNIQVVGRGLTDLFAAMISGLIAYHSVRLVVGEFGAHTIAFATVPVWVCQLILPVSFGVMAIRFLALAASAIGSTKEIGARQ